MWVITVDGFVLIAGFYSGICQKVHIHIKRTELSAIPESRDERKQWLFDSFKEKDRYSEALANELIWFIPRLITEFVSSGLMPGPKQSLPLPLSYSLTPALLYGALLFLIVTTKRGRTFWIGTLILYSLCGYMAIQRKLLDWIRVVFLVSIVVDYQHCMCIAQLVLVHLCKNKIKFHYFVYYVNIVNINFGCIFNKVALCLRWYVWSCFLMHSATCLLLLVWRATSVYLCVIIWSAYVYSFVVVYHVGVMWHCSVVGFYVLLQWIFF